MKIEPLSQPGTGPASDYLMPEEVARELRALMESADVLRKLELVVRLKLIKAKKGSYDELEHDLIYEAIGRLILGAQTDDSQKGRKWPRGKSAFTMIKETARSILHDVRYGADALTVVHKANPSPDWEETWQEQGGQDLVTSSIAHDNVQECLEKFKAAFSDDPVCWDILVARNQLGYSPRETQELLNISQTTYESKLTKIKRRLSTLVKT